MTKNASRYLYAPFHDTQWLSEAGEEGCHHLTAPYEQTVEMQR